jgi:hypothetical protein
MDSVLATEAPEELPQEQLTTETLHSQQTTPTDFLQEQNRKWVSS